MNGSRFKNNDNNFDLDSYLEEKSNSSEGFENQEKTEEASDDKGNFLRNTILIGGFLISTLLYFNNWSFSQVYGNIFGVEELQQANAPVAFPQENENLVVNGNTIATVPSGKNKAFVSGDNLIIMPESANESDVIIIDNQGSSENILGLESLERLEGLESLERLEGLEGLEALEQLEGISGLENLSDGIESIIELSLTEAFKGIENATRLARENQASQFPTTIDAYKSELSENNLNNEFKEETITQLYEAKVPVSVLKTLDETGLLESIGVQTLIERYKKD